MIEEGLRLMLVGMSGVFGFLILLVLVMHASGRVWGVLAGWFPEPVVVGASGTPTGGSAVSSAAAASSAREEETIAVVLAIATAAAPASVTAAAAARREERST